MICHRYFAATAARLAMMATTSNNLTACSNHESTTNRIQMTTRATTICMAGGHPFPLIQPGYYTYGALCCGAGDGLPKGWDSRCGKPPHPERAESLSRGGGWGHGLVG